MTRALDGAAHQDEQGVPEEGEKRLRDQLLQADEQLRARQNDGKPEEPRGREDCTELGRRQDLRLVASPSFAKYDIFGNDVTGIHMHNSKLLKPVHIGTTIFENSKILVHGFSHGHLKARY